MLDQFVLLIIVSYSIFIFTSSSANPFVAMKEPLRRRTWRLGRAIALASLVAGTLSIFVFNLYHVDARIVVSIYLALISLFIIPSVIKFRKTSIWR